MSNHHSQRISFRQLLFWGFSLVIGAGLFWFTRDFIICWRITSLPGIPPETCIGASVDPLETPVISIEEKELEPTSTPEPESPEIMEYPTWDGASRINILFVGLRGGDPKEEDCPFCTDTLILLTVDPATKTAGMLSIPRDLWVNIPGFGYSRINTAWTLGRGSKLPGGGPALAMNTVSHVIGVPVDNYVQVDFDTFVDVIDLIGGVDIYNDETLFLDPVYHGQEFKKVKLTCCGERHLNGRVALAYARCRYESAGCKDGDLGRARRQQKIIFAIRDKVLDPEYFHQLLAQAPELYNTFSDGIHTNMTLDDAIKLAVLMQDISRENIRNAVIDNSMMVADSTVLGGMNASILRPVPEKVRILRDEIFTSSGPVGPMAQGDPLALMLADDAHIRVLNGTTTKDLDARMGRFLLQQGIVVTEYGKTKTLSRTTIVLYKPKLYALLFIMDVLQITRSPQILIKPDESQTVDLEILVGSDWVNKLPPATNGE